MSNDLLPDDDFSDSPGSRPGFLSSLKERLPSVPPQDLTKPAHRMQSPEDVYGYVILGILFVVGIILALVHGPGSPKHPNALLPALGSMAAVVTGVVIYRFRNRFFGALGVIITAFLIILQHPPSSLIGLWWGTFILAFPYMVWLTRRQSKAARAQMEAEKRSGRGSPRDRRASAATSAGSRRRKKKGKDDEDEDTKRPAANKRYTPPQPPKPKRSRNLSADEALAGKTKSKPKAKAKASAASGDRGADDDLKDDGPRRHLLRRRP